VEVLAEQVQLTFHLPLRVTEAFLIIMEQVEEREGEEELVPQAGLKVLPVEMIQVEILQGSTALKVKQAVGSIERPTLDLELTRLAL